MTKNALQIASVLALGGWLMMGQAVSAAVLGPIAPTDDTYVGFYNPSLNHGDGGVMEAGDGSRYPYIKFDVSSVPVGSTVQSVSITVTKAYSAGNGSGETLSLFSVPTSWSESTLTYDNQPTLDTTQLDSATFKDSDPNQTTVYTFSSPALVALAQTWVDSSSNNNGIRLDSNGGGYLGLYSKDITGYENAFKPTLTLTYTAVPEPASLGLLATGALALLGRRRRSVA